MPTFQGWGQIDMRIVNMMDPSLPARWTDASTWNVPTPTTTHKAGIDDRIFSDFQFLTSCGFKIRSRVLPLFLLQVMKRDTYISTWTEPMPVFYKTENDLLKAEALLHQSNATGAAAIINAGTG